MARRGGGVLKYPAMHTVTVEEAQAHLPELIAETQRGEEVVITQDDQPVAKLAPAPVTTTREEPYRFPLFGLLKGQVEYAADFDKPLDDFRPYME